MMKHTHQEKSGTTTAPPPSGTISSPDTESSTSASTVPPASPLPTVPAGSPSPDPPDPPAPPLVEAARILQSRCPACFGGRKYGKPLAEWV